MYSTLQRHTLLWKNPVQHNARNKVYLQNFFDVIVIVIIT